MPDPLLRLRSFGGLSSLPLEGFRSNDRYAAALQIVAWSAFAGPFGAFVAAALSLPDWRGRAQGSCAMTTLMSLTDRFLTHRSASSVCTPPCSTAAFVSRVLVVSAP